MSSGTSFSLLRDHLDNSRVNLQHCLWVKQFGYLLHPDIPTDKKDIRIADIGTATGIWLIDLAETLPPSVQLDGFDITLDATPPSKWLPSNVTLQHWDARTEPPREWIGTYDVVHIRLFAIVFDEHEAVSMLRRLRKLLKPGGYLQWAEVDMSSCGIEKAHPSNKVDAMIELLGHSNKEYIKEEWSWCPKLPGLFLREGFENVRQDVRDTPPHLLTPTHECSLFLLDSWVRRMVNGTGQGAKYRALIQQVEREASQGSVWKFTRWTVVGRKPFKDASGEGLDTIPVDKDAHPGGHLFFPY